MNLRLVMAVSLFAAVPMIAYAQDEPDAEPTKPTIADAKKLVQTISSNPTKLKAYCDMGKILRAGGTGPAEKGQQGARSSQRHV